MILRRPLNNTEAQSRRRRVGSAQPARGVTDMSGGTTSESGGVCVDQISKSFGEDNKRVSVLDGISLSIEHGEFVSLIGPSGCGKSTLLKCMAGLLQYDSGQISVDGAPVRQASRGKAIGLVPQSPALLPWLSVLENVELPLKVNRKSNVGRALRDPKDILEEMGLGHALDRSPAELSGGMQQRVAIARAFVFDPDVLLMDEPFSALDEITRSEQRLALMRFWQSNRKTVVFVTHAIPEAVMLSDRIIVMSANPGRIVEDISVNLPRPRERDMYENPAFRETEQHVRSLLRATRTTDGPDV